MIIIILFLETLDFFVNIFIAIPNTFRLQIGHQYRYTYKEKIGIRDPGLYWLRSNEIYSNFTSWNFRMLFIFKLFCCEIVDEEDIYNLWKPQMFVIKQKKHKYDKTTPNRVSKSNNSIHEQNVIKPFLDKLNTLALSAKSISN